MSMWTFHQLEQVNPLVLTLHPHLLNTINKILSFKPRLRSGFFVGLISILNQVTCERPGVPRLALSYGLEVVLFSAPLESLDS
jgi:hypothetical protein